MAIARDLESFLLSSIEAFEENVNFMFMITLNILTHGQWNVHVLSLLLKIQIRIQNDINIDVLTTNIYAKLTK